MKPSVVDPANWSGVQSARRDERRAAAASAAADELARRHTADVARVRACREDDADAANALAVRLIEAVAERAQRERSRPSLQHSFRDVLELCAAARGEVVR